jgi:hypothetical protein
MKKDLTTFAAKILFLMTIISIASCSRKEMDTTDILNEKTAKEDIRAAKFTRAMQTARDAARLLDGESITRAEYDRQIDENEIKFIVADNATRSDAEPDTLMYVFNYVDDAGFAVVSAVGESGEMLAVTEQGHFNSMEEIENEGFRIFMEAATVYTDSLRWAEKEATRGGGQTGPEYLEDYMVIIDTVAAYYPPLISTCWEQGRPYNEFCPYDDGIQCPTGCVAIAVGQILGYHEYPTCWMLGYLNGNPEINVDWSSLKSQSTCSLCTSYYFCTDHIPLAIILRQIGFLANMNYDANGSCTTDDWAKTALSHLGYNTSNVINYSFDYVKYSIEMGRPLYMGASRCVNDIIDGHAWVIDGYSETIYTYYCYSKPHNFLTWTLENTLVYTYRYNHINWGWGGDCNGFFSSNCFNTQSGSYDTGCSHLHDVNFTFNFKIIYNIYKQ